MVPHQGQSAVGRDPIPGAQLTDHVGGDRFGARAGADQLTAARPHHPATGIQRAQRHALLLRRKVQGMWTRRRAPLCLAHLGWPVEIQILAERARGAVVTRMLSGTEQRVAGGEVVVQPSPGSVREVTGTVRVNAVAPGKLLHVKLGEPLDRPADLIADGA